LTLHPCRYINSDMTKKLSKDSHILGVHCSISGGVYNAPIEGARLGCRAIQLFTGSNQQWRSKSISDEDADRFKGEMDRGKIEIAFSHTTYLINLAAPDKEILKKSIDTMIEELRRCSLLSIPFAVLHPGSPKEKGLDWGIKRIADSINKIFSRTHELKTKIALETTAGQGSSVGSKFEELAAIRELVEDKSRIGFCLDTCHIFAAGYELRDKSEYDRTWKEFRNIIGMKDLLAIHLNDSKFEIGMHKDRHAHIGEGEIGKAGFTNIMNDPKLAKVPMVLETPKGEDPKKQDSKNLSKLRSLIK